MTLGVFGAHSFLVVKVAVCACWSKMRYLSVLVLINTSEHDSNISPMKLHHLPLPHVLNEGH